jgi:CRP/FNR family transcriptional regulator, cyclic AMP receptor protein
MKRPKKKRPFDPKAFLLKINGGRTVLECRKNQYVYRQGDPADSVFYIQTGKAKVTVLSEQGKEAVVALLGPGDFFGEGCLGGQALRMATVAALTPCVITQITKTEIVSTIHDEPAFAELFISHLLARNSRVEEDLVDQLFNSSEKRLARTLLLLANFGKEGDPEPVLAKISQETLAEIIGTTRSRVSFFMNKFRRLGLIKYNGRIEVHRSLLNLVLHEKPEIKKATKANGQTRRSQP